MAGENVEELGPFARAPGVGHVPGDENEVERPGGVLGLETSHDLRLTRSLPRGPPRPLSMRKP